MDDTATPAHPAPPRQIAARTTEPSDSTRARWARMGKLVDTARSEGHADGLRAGYAEGWRWGWWSGLAVGALLIGAAWLLVAKGWPA